MNTVAGLIDFAVYRALTTRGISTEEAAREIGEVVLAWLARRSRNRRS